MYYQKILLGDSVIEFHNNWLGEETIVANGQIVSKKSSVWGCNHYFTLLEDGHQNRYVLTTKIDANFQVKLDLSRNGELIQENIAVAYNTKSLKGIEGNRAKKQGLAKLQLYDLDDALDYFKQALDVSPKDPEIYFHMACAYSVLERTADGFEALKQAVAYNLQDQEMILNHDMLAFIRIHPAFENFLSSGFQEYDLKNK